MDPMVRSRRGAAGQGEPVATGAFSDQLEQEYSAALSQADSGIVPRGSSYVDQGACPPGLRSAVAPGEASPGTLEQGGVVGGAAGASTSFVGGIPSLPTASPFHSARVQEEVALQRKRPSGLDQEQARVGSGNLDMEGGLEPNYSAAFDTAEGFGPRVARVEAVGPREAATLEGSVVGPGREGVSTGMPMLEEKRDSAAGLQPGVAVEGLDPPDDDAPELLPDNDRTARLEQVVAQLIDENRSLKRRVEQAELRSHSSWHSGTPGEVLASPMSFAMDGGPRVGENVQTWSELGRFIGVPPGGLEGAVPANFPGLRNDVATFGSVGSVPGSREQQALRNAGLPTVASVASGQRAMGLELVPVIGESSIEKGPSELWQSSGVPSAPPLPLPGMGYEASSNFAARGTQSMRQFTTQATAEASGMSGGFHTPRSSAGGHMGFDAQGYPISPGGTVIRPPPLPPPRVEPFLQGAGFGGQGVGIGGVGQRVVGDVVRPEEPAKYINELPKLNQTELSQSAVTCGNWLAQVRQVLVGLSPSADVWWKGVEGPATMAYRRWLVADPLGRLGIDPSTVRGEFDPQLYGRVESRAVSLLLAAVPQSVRDDVVTNRWLSSAAILFRILCLFQPGGSSERSHLLSQLVNPEQCKTFGDAIKGLRKWQQGLQRAGEIQATLPDASLLLKGVDGATSSLLSAHPMIGFRVNAFRHQLAIDYNPSVASVVQLVRLIQAECEAGSITSDAVSDKRAKTAALTTPGPTGNPPSAKSVPAPPPPPGASVAAGSPKAGSPSGKGGRAKAKAKSGVQAKGIAEEAGVRAEASVASASAGSASSGAQANPESLVAEATRLLKGVSLKVLRVDDEVDLAWVRSALTNASNPDFCLVDSGATNALRPASDQEIGTCRTIHVDLASGGTELLINESGTLLHSGPCQVILPASYLIQLGFSIVWKRRGCRIKHPKKGCLDVTVVKGCPLIPREVGLALLSEYEGRRVGAPLISKVEVMDLQTVLTPEQSRVWLRDRLVQRGEGLTDVDQLVFLRGMFPGVPMEVLARACVPALDSGFVDWGESPWNRRFRRSVGRAASGSVLISVSSGQSSWKGLGKVVAVSDSEKGLGSRLVFQLLLNWAEKGKVGGLIQGDGVFETGAKAGEFSWDSQVHASSDWRTLCEGSVKILRWFLLFSVAQASKDAGSECLPNSGKKESAQSPSPPASAVASRDRRTSSGSDRDHSMVFMVCGFPGDPRVPVKRDERRRTWDPASVLSFAQVYELNRAEFDQSCFGALCIRECELLTSSWFLYEAVHEVRMSWEAKAAWELVRPEGILQSRVQRQEGWATGLLRVIQGSWCRWCALGCQAAEATERKLLLAKMTAEESYAKHVANDHVPFLKGCPECIRAQGRQRSHWRSAFTGVHAASFDIAGPFVPGQAFNPEVSGRDKGKGYRYFLACAYTIPDSYCPEGLEVKGDAERVAPAEDDASHSAGATGIGEFEDLFPELWDLPEVGTTSVEGVKAVRFRVKEKRPEDEDPLVEEPADSSSPVVAEPKFKTRTLFLGTPLRTKRGKEVLSQVQCLINRLEAHGYPVNRYHSDRAKELRASGFDKGIHATWTPGDSPAGNKAELGVQNLKGLVRKLLGIAKLEVGYWPLALSHATERNWVMFGESLGKPQVPLLPFGVKVEARKRFKTGFEAQWQSRSVPGLYLGIAPNTPGGHLVLIEDGDSRKVLLTNTVYPVRGEDTGVPRRPKFRLVGKRSHFAIKVVAAARPFAVSEKTPFAHAKVRGGGPSSVRFFEDQSLDNGCEASGYDDCSSELSDASEGEEPKSWTEEGLLGVWGSKEEIEGDTGEVPGVYEIQVLDCDPLEAGGDFGKFTTEECLEVLQRGFGVLKQELD
ncbi:GIP [Symbiodinium sp. CCMP2592]|nr:GIP [Symbiodinium sp. CCMP2592]